MNMDAVFGLRSLLCWWIIRAHGRSFGLLCDVAYADVYNRWRTSVFVFLAGMTMAMQARRATRACFPHARPVG